MSDFPWKVILSLGFRLIEGVLKIIGSVVWFWSWIVVLKFEVWMDYIVAVWTDFVWAMKVKIKIPIRVRIRNVF